MIARVLALAFAGTAALVVPHAASAQPDSQRYLQPYDREQPDYDPYRGYTREDDYDRADRRFAGYPEFRGTETRIRREIHEGVRRYMLEPDDARDLMSDLREIRRREAELYREHGWNLPYDDRNDIRSDLAELDRRVLDKRAEP